MRATSLSKPHRLLAGALTTLLLIASLGAGADQPLKSGEFTGRSDHITTGGVSVVRTDTGIAVVLAEDFSLDGAPDPKVGFGRDGTYDSNAQLGHLASKTGQQTYTVPSSVDVDQYNEVYIWCEKFSVPLGVAELK